MKVIVCGAGLVGYGIARQLVNEENNVTIIDSDPLQIKKVSDSLDVSTFIGFPSHPTVLEDAGASTAEMIIAVMASDEINMIICQVAHSLFNIPLKIARIRHQNYLQPIWKDLYRHDHLPIDHIISPEKEVANAVINRLHVPGAIDCIPFGDGIVNMIEVRCLDNCPVIDKTIEYIEQKIPALKLSIIGIHRDQEFSVPRATDTLTAGDEVFFTVDKTMVKKAMTLFGYEEREARRVLIVGGGNIGLFVAESIQQEAEGINAKLIELSKERAEYIAGKLSGVTVINGDSLDREILLEANIESTETVISVTNDDEVNILSSLLSKRYGCQRAIALINKGRSYGPLISSLGIDVAVNPREMTVSSILQHTRRGKVFAAHSICGGMAEVLEIEAISQSAVVGKTVDDLELPTGVKMSCIIRNGELIIPNRDTIIVEDDHMILLTLSDQVKKVDKIFSDNLDYF